MTTLKQLTMATLTLPLMLMAACGSIMAGDPCSGSDALCSTKSQALACYGGKYVAVTCPGPGGCVAAGGSVTCSEGSTKSLGDTCFKTGLALCDLGKKTHMKCSSSGIWVVDVDCSANNEVCKDDGTTVSCVTP